MPYGGGRRRRAEWDHGGRWQWRQAYTGRRSWSTWEDLDVHRGEDVLRKYRIEGEELYNRASRARVPDFHGVPAAMSTCVEEMPSEAYWNMAGTMTQNSNQMVMRDGMEWASFIDAPVATLPSPCPPPLPLGISSVSSDVQLVLDNILRLQCMGSEQAAKILKDAAAQQEPYED